MNVMHTHLGDLYSQHDSTPLTTAIAKKHFDVVEKLIELKGNVNVAGRVSRVVVGVGVGVRVSQHGR